MRTPRSAPLLRLAALAAVALSLAGCRMPPPAKPVGPQYVRVEKINDRYWFVRGDERFVAMGVNVVQPTDGSKGDGRYYDVLPKYNGDKALWAKDAEERLQSWNFNTAAGWSDDALYARTNLYHTRVVWFGAWGNRDSRLIDVFSDAYAADVDKTAREHVAPHATNEYLIGWFLNNEMPWYGERGWPTTPLVSLLSRYLHLPPGAPGKIRAVEFLRERYGNDFAAFRANWEVSATSFDELLRGRQIKPVRPESKLDVIAWSGIVAEQYFKLSLETLRRYDPHHLFLGIRFSERAQEPVMEACGRYADVVSVNMYRKTGHFDTLRAGAIAALVKKPLMITEFSFRAMENSSGCSNAIGADVTVATQQDRADGYRLYVTNALAQPYIVGLDWFMYHDQPPAGRFDGENSNYGLVDIHDSFYTTLLGTITEVNAMARQIHEQSPTPMPDYDPSVLAEYIEVRLAHPGQTLAQPVVFADAGSSNATWGDTPARASLATERSDDNTLLLRIEPGSGWGCGVTFQPVESLPKRADGSVDVAGARRVVVVMTAPAGKRFAVGIQESGHGNSWAQNYDGLAGADGESYVNLEHATEDGRQEYVFDLTTLEPSTSYGNQRGNHAVDTAALSTVQLYFPGGQGGFEARLEQIRFE